MTGTLQCMLLKGACEPAIRLSAAEAIARNGQKVVCFFGVSKPSEPRLKRVLEILERVSIREGVRVAPLAYDKSKSRLRGRIVQALLRLGGR